MAQPSCCGCFDNDTSADCADRTCPGQPSYPDPTARRGLLIRAAGLRTREHDVQDSSMANIETVRATFAIGALQGLGTCNPHDGSAPSRARSGDRHPSGGRRSELRTAAAGDAATRVWPGTRPSCWRRHTARASAPQRRRLGRQSPVGCHFISDAAAVKSSQ
ncbi:unnamed protein product [Symbiodinium pilosum]|uniref:Uncharacterized protein n=1 Tax=Symbiodinium pilosum TaxID=2952 RepID=A0A812WD97_SYMPI|nr:unnamed protein product [Symbiodinium pilosum]